MKNPYTITALCLIGIAFFIKAGIFNALLLFLLVGAIPGTSYNVPALGMLLIVAALMWVILFRLTALETFEVRTRKYLAHKYQTRRKSAPAKKAQRA
jgi:ABC-type dipeptide/oligopeptide/nickel transport system permease subunit